MTGTTSETKTPPSVADNAVAAAEGTRTTARWIASALGAIPSLAVLASIVRAPGDAGFEPLMLAIGVALAAIGGLVGVLGFAHVLAPLALEDKDLQGLDLRRLTGQPYTSIDTLNADTERVRSAVTDLEYRSTVALTESGTAEEAAQRAELEAHKAEQSVAEGTDSQVAVQARALADTKRTEAAEKATGARALASSLQLWTDQLSRRDAIRRDAFLLKAADEVGQRYKAALWGASLAVVLIAAGIVLLGLAPKTKASTTPTLVMLTLNVTGKAALGCTVSPLSALKVGGTDAAPTVITFPVTGCGSKTLTFVTSGPTPMGTVQAVEPVKGP